MKIPAGISPPGEKYGDILGDKTTLDISGVIVVKNYHQHLFEKSKIYIF